jgi:hypothetical protein
MASSSDAPKRSATALYIDALGRVRRAPTIWLGAWLTTLLIGLPLALVLRGMLAQHLGASLAAGRALDGVDWDWWQEFRRQASGIGTTFAPSILGFAAVLRNISDLLDNARLAPVLAGVVTAWLIVWSFLSGGMLDRYARNRPTGTSAFFAACGRHFCRFLRLGACAGLAYYVLFAWVHPWLLVTLWGRLTRDVNVERTAFVLAALGYAVFSLLLALTSIVFDYARVRTVIEDRRSALGALSAAWRFACRNATAVAQLYALNAMCFLLGAAAYALIAPEASRGGLLMWVGFAAGQLWIVLRVVLKLTSYASGISLFQSQLAHAGYVATTIPPPPESPAAEAIRGEPRPATAP